MKKVIVGFLSMVSIAIIYAQDRGITIESDIGPSFARSTNTAVVTLSAPSGNNKRNCLEYVTFFSTSATTIYVLDGNTTDYQLTVAASAIHDKTFYEPFCGTNNTAVTIKSSCTVVGAAGTVNYKGFVGK